MTRPPGYVWNPDELGNISGLADYLKQHRPDISWQIDGVLDETPWLIVRGGARDFQVYAGDEVRFTEGRFEVRGPNRWESSGTNPAWEA